jgi:hypothetical protein
MNQTTELILNKFDEATRQVAQLPYNGVIEVGDAVVAAADAGNPHEVLTIFSGLSLRRGTPEYIEALTRTIEAHDAQGVSNNRGLGSSLGMVMELVQSNFFRGVALLSRGDDTVETPTIEPLNPDDVNEAIAFLVEAPNRQLVRSLFGAVRERLAGSAEVGRRLPVYMHNIAEISGKYWPLIRDARNDPARLKELDDAKAVKLNAQRDLLMSVVVPEIFAAVEPYADRSAGVRAFAGAVACAAPSRAMLDKYPRQN